MDESIAGHITQNKKGKTVSSSSSLSTLTDNDIRLVQLDITMNHRRDCPIWVDIQKTVRLVTQVTVDDIMGKSLQRQCQASPLDGNRFTRKLQS